MLWGIPIEVLLAASYAVFLAAVAVLLERLARHSHNRTERIEIVGFRYHHDFDRWECPQGHHLFRIGSDPVGRTVRYRAPSHVCNACRTKPSCTDSDSGRKVERRTDSWLDSSIRRFHRGLSLTLLILAVLFVVIEAIRYRQPQSLLVLAVPLALISPLAVRVVKEIAPATDSAVRASTSFE